MDIKSIWEKVKGNIKVTVTVVLLGVAATIGLSANGCEFDVDPAPAAVEAPAEAAEGAGGSGGTEAAPAVEEAPAATGGASEAVAQ